MNHRRRPRESTNEVCVRLVTAATSEPVESLRRDAQVVAQAFTALVRAMSFADDESDADIARELRARLDALRHQAEEVLSSVELSAMAAAASELEQEEETTTVQRGSRPPVQPRIVKPEVGALRRARTSRASS